MKASLPRSLKEAAAEGREQAILACRVRVTLPTGLWLQALTAAHPDVHAEVMDRMELGNGLTMLEVQLPPSQGRGWSEEIRGLPGVHDLELIDAAGGAQIFRVTFRGRTFLPLLKELKLLRHFPFPVQEGVATWTVVGPEGRVREMLKKLQRQASGVRVEAVHHGPVPRGSPLLTPRQQEILHRAMVEGYFDVPRRISLTDLAQRIGVAISTLSVTLAVIEKKILEGRA